MMRDPRATRAATLVIVGPSGTEVNVSDPVGPWSLGDDPAKAGALAGKQIERAVALAKAGDVDGIVTAPIDKSVLLRGGYDFPGHTEMLASLTQSKVAMMMTSPKLRVVLATMHIALRDVPRALTRERIVEIAATTKTGLRDWFGVKAPRLALCALNPHAGDNGRFGSEDDDVLAPAARDAGLTGPLPADTVF